MKYKIHFGTTGNLLIEHSLDDWFRIKTLWHYSTSNANMVFEKLISFMKRLEDSKHPLMGPTIKALYLFGLWRCGNKYRFLLFQFFHCTTFIFVVTEFIDLYRVRNDINLVINNLSLTVLSLVCVSKCFFYVFYRNQWSELVMEISKTELKQLKSGDSKTKEIIKEYTKYTRIITYLFWMVVFFTDAFLIISPFLKCLSKSYREAILTGVEPVPQIMCSWFPFDNTKMPGYAVGVIVHVIMGCQGSGVLAVYDTNAVAVMSYLKGQMFILKYKCTRIFDGVTSEKVVLNRIKECHELHNVLINQYKMFDSLLSPTMFLYVLLCSMTICSGIVQFTSKDATLSQKVWMLQYSAGLVFQLFLYCWHGNEVSLQSEAVDRGVYESEWWKANVRIRKQILLLAGKLNHTFVLEAGPFTNLSVPTFIGIMKGAYSFYTLFSEMQFD